MQDSKFSLEELSSKLSLANARLYETQSLSRIGSWDWDMVNNKVDWSQMMFELLGLSPETSIPSYELALFHVHPDDKVYYENALSVALENKSSYYIENRIISSTNEVFQIIARGIFILNEEGNIVRMYGTVQDVTRQKSIEQKLRAQKDLAFQNEKLKTSFFENVSHEIRTPLNAILGFSKLLRNEANTKATKDICINQIQLGSKKLLQIIDDIVDLSAIDSNTQQLEFQAHNLNNIIDELYQEFALALSESPLKLKTQKSLSDDNSLILTDKFRLEQIISNLLTNAHKFTESGTIEFGYEQLGDILKFYVKDSGIGIHKKDQDLILKRFGQIQNIETRMNLGVGLGIPISIGLVKLFDGKFWFESALGKGTTFYFSIPYKPIGDKTTLLFENKEEKHIAIPSSEQSDKEFTILIAEDDLSNFYLFQIEFEHKYNIRHAKNGREVIEMAKSPDIDLVIMDLRMPIINGYEAAKEIRKFNANIPILAYTAYFIRDELRVDVKEAGINDILTKPASISETTALISKYCK